MANLWKSLSEAYTTGSVSEIPLYERQTHPRSALDGWDIKATEADLPALTARGPKPVDFPVEKITFTVSDHDLALLKKGILAEDKSVTILSTQDCLTAAILVAQTRSQEDLGWFDPPVCNLLNVFNVRFGSAQSGGRVLINHTFSLEKTLSRVQTICSGQQQDGVTHMLLRRSQKPFETR